MFSPRGRWKSFFLPGHCHWGQHKKAKAWFQSVLEPFSFNHRQVVKEKAGRLVTVQGHLFTEWTLSERWSGEMRWRWNIQCVALQLKCIWLYHIHTDAAFHVRQEGCIEYMSVVHKGPVLVLSRMVTVIVSARHLFIWISVLYCLTVRSEEHTSELQSQR